MCPESVYKTGSLAPFFWSRLTMWKSVMRCIFVRKCFQSLHRRSYSEWAYNKIVCLTAEQVVLRYLSIIWECARHWGGFGKGTILHRKLCLIFWGFVGIGAGTHQKWDRWSLQESSWSWARKHPRSNSVCVYSVRLIHPRRQAQVWSTEFGRGSKMDGSVQRSCWAGLFRRIFH